MSSGRDSSPARFALSRLAFIVAPFSVLRQMHNRVKNCISLLMLQL